MRSYGAPGAGRRFSIGVLLVATALLAAVSAGAEPDAAPTRGQELRGRLDQAARVLAERARAAVLVDPEIAPATAPGIPPATGAVESALDIVCRPLRGVAWKKVYLSRGAGAAAVQNPPAAELSDLVRALARLDGGSRRIQDPDRKREIVYLREATPTAADRAKRRLREQPVYLIYSMAGPSEGRSREGLLGELQSAQLAMGLSDEQAAQTYLQVAQLVQSSPPAELEKRLAAVGAGGMRVWAATSPEERSALMEAGLHLLEKAMAAKEPPMAAPRDPPTRRPPTLSPVRSLVELEHAAGELARRAKTHIVVDPTLAAPGFLPPLRPSLSCEAGLQVLTEAVPRSAWRRVHLPAKEAEHLDARAMRDQLVADVRLLEGLDAAPVSVEDPVFGEARTVLSGRIGDAAAALEIPEAAGLGDPPVYALYSPGLAIPGATQAERLANVQRAQGNLLLRMDADQLAGSMDRLVRTWGAADPGQRTQLLGLPLTALLLGVWLPHAAKERGGTQGR